MLAAPSSHLGSRSFRVGLMDSVGARDVLAGKTPGKVPPMDRPARKLGVSDMQTATHFAKRHAEDLVERATRLQADSDRDARTKAGLCRTCYYARGGIAGAAMTTQPCSACLLDQTYGSTATDLLCLPCAKEHDLCKRCGGDREQRTLRRKWPTFPTV